MARGRQRDQWWHTAWLVSWMLEVKRDPKKRAAPFTAGEFHPLYREVERTPTRADATDTVRALASAFGAKRGTEED